MADLARRYVEAHTVAPTPTDVREAARAHASSAPAAIFLGLLIDTIPESLVIGMSMIGRATVSAALIVGLFLSNFPEALSSAVGMKAQRVSSVRIVGMWVVLMVLTGLGALLGNVLFTGAPPWLIAAFEATAARAMLVMIAQTALPEAYEQGGWRSGVATLLGILSAFFVGTLGDIAPGSADTPSARSPCSDAWRFVVQKVACAGRHRPGGDQVASASSTNVRDPAVCKPILAAKMRSLRRLCAGGRGQARTGRRPHVRGVRLDAVALNVGAHAKRRHMILGRAAARPTAAWLSLRSARYRSGPSPKSRDHRRVSASARRSHAALRGRLAAKR